MQFLNALPGAIAEGLIWGLMAIGVYISYKILDFADLTVDSSICTGGCVCVMVISAGMPIWLGMLLGTLAGAVAGFITGLFHTLLGIPAILSGILSQLLLYSVNLAVYGGKSLEQIPFPRKPDLWVDMSDNIRSIFVLGGIVALLIIVLWLFFYTEVGLTIKSTGDNPDMSRAQGINVQRNKVLGLTISNGIVGLAGTLLAQYNGSMDVKVGRGAIVIGLAAIFIGLSVSLKIKPNFVVSLIGVVCGGIVYYIIFNFVLLLGINTDYLKMLSAFIVAAFLGIPYLKGKFLTKKKSLEELEQEMEEMENA